MNDDKNNTEHGIGEAATAERTGGTEYVYSPTPLMLPTSHYDKTKADRAVKFIEMLKHTKGKWEGKPFKLFPWQERIVRDLFGIVKADGYRQFKTAYVEVPKKNGKSELAAAIALYLLFGDGEMEPEVYSCASDRDQASIVYEVAANMIGYNRVLSDNCKIMKSVKTILFPKRRGKYRVLSSEAFSKHGFNVSGVIFDELHAQPNRELFDVMTKGSGDARTQPLYFLITTAGTNIHSVCYEQHKKARNVLDGKTIDPTFYPVIYGADMEDNWESEEVWQRANPSIGKTIPMDAVREMYVSALGNPEEEMAFRQLRLNQWVKQEKKWLSMRKWELCTGTVDADSLKGRPCWGGLDLSETGDITAFSLVFPPDDYLERTDEIGNVSDIHGTFAILPFFWIAKERLEDRVRRDKVPYNVWERQGLLTTTEGDIIDFRFVRAKITELFSIYNIREIAYDRWQSPETAMYLADEGITMVPFGQGYRDMSPPSKAFYEYAMSRKLSHGGNPILSWMVDNVVITKDAAGNIKPDKNKSSEKIDGVVATIMGLDRAIRRGNLPADSIYDSAERDGLLVL